MKYLVFYNYRPEFIAGILNKEPLLVVENNKKLRLNLSVPEANKPYLKLGETIRFHVRSQPQQKHIALVSRKSGNLDLKLRSEKIEADFINKNNMLKPYMVAETTIPLQNTEPTFFVPKTAVDAMIFIFIFIKIRD